MKTKAKVVKGSKYQIVSDHPRLIPYLELIQQETMNKPLALKFKQNPVSNKVGRKWTPIDIGGVQIVEVWTEAKGAYSPDELKDYEQQVIYNLYKHGWTKGQQEDLGTTIGERIVNVLEKQMKRNLKRAC